MLIHWSISEILPAKLAIFDAQGRKLFQCLPGDEPQGKDLCLLAEAENLKWALERLVEMEIMGAEDNMVEDHIKKSLTILDRANGRIPEYN